jgi:hypothetical protein
MHIDPETGEVITPTNKPTVSGGFPKSPIHKLPFWSILLICLTSQIVMLCLLFFSIHQDIRLLNSHLDSLDLAATENGQQIDEVKQSIESINHQISQILSDEDESAFENFWGDDASSMHLQSMKYLGFYTLGNNLYAHTKSVFGSRYLSTGEKVNDIWRVKEINAHQIILEGEEGKTFLVFKEVS